MVVVIVGGEAEGGRETLCGNALSLAGVICQHFVVVAMGSTCRRKWPVT